MDFLERSELAYTQAYINGLEQCACCEKIVLCEKWRKGIIVWLCDECWEMASRGVALTRVARKEAAKVERKQVRDVWDLMERILRETKGKKP